jgi:glycosyltransferase involved in cell wall biosynthesis
MKILLTVDPELTVPPIGYGGIERIVDMLVNIYVKEGHDVTLCANPGSKVPCKLVGWKGLNSQRIFDVLKNTATLTSLVKKNRYDVVHSFSRLAYMSVIFPMKIPKIMSYQREPSLAQIKKAASIARKGTLIFTGCSNYISNQVKAVATAYTVYNCAPVEQYTFVEKVSNDAPLIFLGRIEDIKGTHIAIEVAQKTGKQLVIAGNIPKGKEEYFEQKVKPYLNDKIIYVGTVNDQQKNEWLGKCSVFLMPILWNEPFGIVMAEAMACGTPVVGFARGSVPEVIEDGINGFVCNNADEMVDKIKQIDTISRASVRKTAEKKFSSEVIAKHYLGLYQSLQHKN